MAAKRAKRAKPTKEEIQAARAKLQVDSGVRREGRALISAANKVLDRAGRKRRGRRVIRLRPVNAEASAFYTWQHDFNTLVSAVARAPGMSQGSAGDLASLAARAADRMREEVAARKPKGAERAIRFRRGPGRSSKMAEWQEWQEQFDGFIHHLAAHTNLDANAVIDRSVALADAAMQMVKARRKVR